MSNIARIAFCGTLLGLSTGSLAAEKITAPDLDFFEKRIRPVLVSQCYECHSADSDELQGGLKLDSRQAVRTGGDSGPSVVPGDVEASLLIRAIRYDEFEMPPQRKLDPNVIADFERWVKMGAPDPREATVVKDSQEHSIDDRIGGAETSWAFRVPVLQPLPDVRNSDWPRERIDYFVLKKLEEHDITPATEADRRTWIRRVTFDVTGLPPTPEEIDSFLNDNNDGAYARVIERLLASPHFGERWARMWLDVARYAEDQAHIVGDDKSLFYPNAYLYRDWVVNAFNDDMPFDRFVTLQLAADVVAPEAEEHLASLGFLGLGPKYYDRKRLAVKAEEWEDRVDTVTRGLLGLTVACARCHDHKYDPISTTDYYALAGVFASTEMDNRPVNSDGKDNDTDNDKEKKKRDKNPADAMHVVREGNAQDLNVFIRGNVDRQGDVVPRRFLQVLHETSPAPFTNGSGRRELAAAIANSKNPLTARVFINRVFGQLTGKPIVATPSNFGSLGEPPSHPELLDDLAARFMDNGWSTKWLVREVVASAMYRQSSDASKDTVAADPSNIFFSRMNRRRLSAEAIRDSMIAATGKLETSIGGQSFEVTDVSQHRRTLYGSVSRFQLNPFLQTFDFPDANVHSARRSETITPLQKLFMMNNPFVVEQAKRFAKRLNESATQDESRIDLAYNLLFGRPATDIEIQHGLSFTKDKPDGWQQYAHALMITNEMMYLD
ncbi:MAG: PSD1 domain-containing protein [Planctomycetales bacterium]|nr:PSD1 domain-containing protein [Planctomycetales bacterium]